MDNNIEESPLIVKLRELLLKQGGGAGSDARNTNTANQVDTSTDTAKNYDQGGMTPDRNEPGVQDATVSDFLGPILMGSLGKVVGLPAGAAAEGATDDVYGSEMREAMKKSMAEPSKGYADGGEVMPDGPSTEDKLKAVLQALGMGASKALSPLTAPIAPIANMSSSVANSPALPAVANAALGTSIPEPKMPAPEPEPMGTPNSGAPMPEPAQPAVAKAPAPMPAQQPQTPPTSDMLSKLTDGDGDKMQALLSQLHDQDKKSKFANALAIIGDTLGNMGNVQAGQRPEGFTSTKLVNDLSNDNRKKSLEMIGQQLASDPKSQTSQMAQMTLMQSMDIKPGDPRSAKIMSMPASSIVQMMPQMTDAVKNSIEREKNMIESRKADMEAANKQLLEKIQSQTADRAARAAETTAANETLHNVGPVNGLFNPGVRDAALNTLKRNMTGTEQPQQGHPQDAQAVHWAHTHPNDPRSRAILAANGI